MAELGKSQKVNKNTEIIPDLTKYRVIDMFCFLLVALFFFIFEISFFEFPAAAIKKILITRT